MKVDSNSIKKIKFKLHWKEVDLNSTERKMI